MASRKCYLINILQEKIMACNILFFVIMRANGFLFFFNKRPFLHHIPLRYIFWQWTCSDCFHWMVIKKNRDPTGEIMITRHSMLDLSGGPSVTDLSIYIFYFTFNFGCHFFQPAYLSLVLLQCRILFYYKI